MYIITVCFFQRLYATYFEGDASLGLEPDEEARQLWLKYLPENRVIPGNSKDNFWEMGKFAIYNKYIRVSCGSSTCPRTA